MISFLILTLLLVSCQPTQTDNPEQNIGSGCGVTSASKEKITFKNVIKGINQGAKNPL